MELITITNNIAILDTETSQKVAEFERTIKTIKEQEETLKTAILEEMERKNILKLETDDITISYIASFDRETFQTKEFKNDHADLYDNYVKMSPVKPSVRIKLK